MQKKETPTYLGSVKRVDSARFCGSVTPAMRALVHNIFSALTKREEASLGLREIRKALLPELNRNAVGDQIALGLDTHKEWTTSTGTHAFPGELLGLETTSKSAL